jgi:hypothetical protein
MTPELQSVLDRLEEVERRNRGPRLTALIAMVLSLAALAAVAARVVPSATAPAPASSAPGVVEASRLLLKDADGHVRGGMEVDRSGVVKLVIGSQDGRSGAALLLANPNGTVQLQLRSPSGVVRVALNGTSEPSVTLTSDDSRSSAALLTRTGSPGQLLLSDRDGVLRPTP